MIELKIVVDKERIAPDETLRVAFETLERMFPYKGDPTSFYGVHDLNKGTILLHLDSQEELTEEQMAWLNQESLVGNWDCTSTQPPTLLLVGVKAQVIGDILKTSVRSAETNNSEWPHLGFLLAARDDETLTASFARYGVNRLTHVEYAGEHPTAQSITMTDSVMDAVCAAWIRWRISEEVMRPREKDRTDDHPF